MSSDDTPVDDGADRSALDRADAAASDQAAASVERGVGRGMALGGDTVYRLENGRVAFVPRGVPGDRADIALAGERRGVLHGRLRTIIEPGPGRVEAPCPFFRAGCGGCQWQQLSYDAQLAQKQVLLGETLRRLGKLEPLPLAEPVAAVDLWRYRTAIRVHVTTDGRAAYAAAHSHDLIPIDDCPIAHPLLQRLLAALRSPLAQAILRDAVAAIRGFAARVATADGADRLLVVVQSEGGRPRSARRLVAELQRTLPELSSAWLEDWHPPASPGRGRPPKLELLDGETALPQEIDGRRYSIGPRTFFQVNPAQTAHLVRLVRAALRAAGPRRVLDLYCGVGLFALSLTDLADEVVGVDSEQEAVALAEQAAEEAVRRSGRGALAPVRFFRADAEAVEIDVLRDADAVVLDPPRSGLPGALIDHLVAAAPPTLVYISCEPSTLARDLRRLTGAGWHLASVQLVDLFPQTYHIESVSVLRR